MGDDAGTPLVVGELRQHVRGAAQFECAHRLQVLALQPEQAAIGLHVEQRCPTHSAGDTARSGRDVCERDERVGHGYQWAGALSVAGGGEKRSGRRSILGPMARYTLVYGLRLVPEGTLARAEDVALRLKNGETAGVTLHTIDGTIPQLRRALDRSLDAFFEFLPGASEEDKREFDDN